MNRFEGKVAIVTGGSNGIGAAIVARLVAEGARVMIADIAAPATLNDSTRFVRTDVGLGSEVEAVVAATLAEWGRLDVLVNNAGIGALAETPDMAEEVWDAVFAVNIRAIYLFCRAAIPAMKGEGGAIVNVASISGLAGRLRHGCLQRLEGRGDQLHPLARARLRARRHPGQCAVSGADRNRDQCSDPGAARRPRSLACSDPARAHRHA